MNRVSLMELAMSKNIRLILLHLTPRSASTYSSSKMLKAIRALKTHGFKVACVAPSQLNLCAHEYDHAHTSQWCEKSYQDIATKLMIPLKRTILVTDGVVLSKGVQRVVDHLDIPHLVSDSGGEEDDLFTDITARILGYKDFLDESRRFFGPYPIRFSEIFYTSSFSFALVNLKPIVPGHVLVIPNRRVDRFEHLDADEVSDLWCSAQLIGKKLQTHYQAHSLTFAIQDGKAAGQTVQHVHVHILPRSQGDIEPNDKVYSEIQKHEKKLAMDNEERNPRSLEIMASEAAILRQLFS